MTISNGSGGTSKTVGSGDTATVTFNDALQPSSICSAGPVPPSGSPTPQSPSPTAATTTTSPPPPRTAPARATATSALSTPERATYRPRDLLRFHYPVDPGYRHSHRSPCSNISGSNKISSNVTTGFPGYAADPQMTDTAGQPDLDSDLYFRTKTGSDGQMGTRMILSLGLWAAPVREMAVNAASLRLSAPTVKRAHNRAREDGAVLILALIFLVSVGLIVTAIAQLGREQPYRHGELPGGEGHRSSGPPVR